MSNEDAKRRGAAAAAVRAVILDPSALAGSRNPVQPLARAERLRGGEHVGWDARRDAVLVLAPLLDNPLPTPVLRAVQRAADDPTVRRLRHVVGALRGELPDACGIAAALAAQLLPFHVAALGCATASAEIAAAALDVAATAAEGNRLPEAFLSFRAALLWASDAQADATHVEYVGGPLYSRLASFDQQASRWVQIFQVFADAEAMVADEDAILRGGAIGHLREQPADVEALAALARSQAGSGGAIKPAPPPAPAVHTLVVCPNLSHLPEPSKTALDRGDSPRALGERIAGRALPLTPAPDPAAFARSLRARFPWAGEAIDTFAHDLVGAPYAAIRPRILVGPPGTGKTAFGRAVLEALGLDVTLYSAAGQMDGGSFGGTSRQWGTWRMSVPAQAILRAERASIGIVVDEVEKAGTSRRWGRLDETLLPFLERHTARAIHDPALECPLDLSAGSYVLTSNGVGGIVQPLLDRAPPLHWPAPRAQDLPVVAAAILSEIRRDRGLDETWLPDLDGEELDALTVWRGGSLRPLRRMVEKVVASRDVLARRLPN